MMPLTEAYLKKACLIAGTLSDPCNRAPAQVEAFLQHEWSAGLHVTANSMCCSLTATSPEMCVVQDVGKRFEVGSADLDA